jgi:hypothetical protein
VAKAHTAKAPAPKAPVPEAAVPKAPAAKAASPKAAAAPKPTSRSRSAKPGPKGSAAVEPASPYLRPRKPGSRSRYRDGEAAEEALRTANRGASLGDRALAERGVVVDEPLAAAPRPPVQRRTAAPKTAAAAKPPKAPKPPKPAKPKPTTPARDRVLLGDTENDLPTGVMGVVEPADLGTGTKTRSDVSPLGQQDPSVARFGARKGHLLGRLFGGSGSDPRNLAWMHVLDNNSKFKTVFENRVAEALRNGNQVAVIVTPRYRPAARGAPDAAVPYELEVWAKIVNGKTIVKHQVIPAAGGLSDITR